jgi:hypothetical protein
VDLSDADIKPAEGMVAVTFLDDAKDDSSGTLPPEPSDVPSSPVPYEGLLAQVLGAGAKTSFKKGQVVVCRPYARDGLCIGTNTHLINAYDIVATIST